MSQILTNMRESVRDLGMILKRSVEKIKIISGLKKEATKIPESWINSKQIYDTPMDWVFDTKPIPVIKNPVARSPVFSFDMVRKDQPLLRSNLAYRIKRTIIFFLLVACLISIFSFAMINPLSLLFYLPTGYIYMDYLRRTRAKKRKGWLALKNIEEL